MSGIKFFPTHAITTTHEGKIIKQQQIKIEKPLLR